ncbi:hypothetical protein BOTBODRAFT_30746 [Botryobasidium botryosum FD-172 SS1]|uniref:Major facilitator superfamily (MFS) profile domain-containing protein n=1 Tax=Botryobasidium botryosum (strain FD-172 SS1) TaxID=930990 RepID=A0A067MYB9_BOTB1|nr:hypothetical protein BOTBODRAFT_30746 [Botryobasidium botryosum FD-172 SS1]
MRTPAALRKARIVVWGEYKETKEEERLLRKIDFFLLTFCCFSYLVNYLDRAAITNAYVSGMKEGLHMSGNELNIINIAFDVGYIVGQIPHSLMLQVVPPRIWFPLMMFIWACFTIGTAGVQNYQQACVLRFFQAVAEASTFSGCNYIFGSWYTERELGKRAGIFAISGMAGTMFSGFIQTGIFASLNGMCGLAGWRWVFIIDGIITVPVSIYGLLYFPGTPITTKAPYFNSSERQLATSRLPPKIKGNSKLNLALLKRVLGSWHIYLFSLLWFWGSAAEATVVQGLFPLFLQAEGYSVAERNNYPTAITAFAIVCTMIAAVQIDYGPKWIWGPIIAVGEIVAGSLIWVYHIPRPAIFFAYILSGIGYTGQVVFFSWANQLLAGDDAKRAIVLFSMNMWSAVLFSFWGILLYPATDAPYFRKGAIALIPISILIVTLCIVIHVLERREQGEKEGLKMADGERRADCTDAGISTLSAGAVAAADPSLDDTMKWDPDSRSGDDHAGGGAEKRFEY